MISTQVASDHSSGVAAGEQRPLILYVVTVDWFFCSHFAERAVAARNAGYRVAVACRPLQHRESIEALGVRVIPWMVSRNGIRPWQELKALLALAAIYRRERPDLVHQVALKPIIYGGLAGMLAGVSGTVRTINAPVGMGFAFSSNRPTARLLRPMIRRLYRGLLAVRGAHVVFENGDDLRNAIEQRFVPSSSAHLIRGAGVDLRRFQPVPEVSGTIRVLLLGRMLREKGVEEFVRAAALLQERSLDAAFDLAGPADPENRGSLTERQLRDWDRQGLVNWLGACRDVPGLLARSHIVVLPSYREGLPKALLEALAAARPIIATDVPGCREVCQHGVNGLLVPPRDAQALAGAMQTLIASPEQRKAYGLAGRKLAEQAFSTDRVQAETLALYRSRLL